MLCGTTENPQGFLMRMSYGVMAYARGTDYGRHIKGADLSIEGALTALARCCISGR
jgi:hypothetical protein